MNDDVKDLVVHVVSFILAVIVSVLTVAFCVFMLKVGIRLCEFAWGIL